VRSRYSTAGRPNPDLTAHTGSAGDVGGYQFFSLGPEAELRMSAAALVAAVDSIVVVVAEAVDQTRPLPLLPPKTTTVGAAAVFAAVWTQYLQNFVAWKSGAPGPWIPP